MEPANSQDVNNVNPENPAPTATPPKKYNWKQRALSALVFIAAFGAVSYFINVRNANKTDKVLENVNNYFESNENWKEFNSTSGQFKVDFPSYPGHDSQTVPLQADLTMTIDTYESSKNNVSYGVNTVVYSSEIDTSNPINNLEGGINGMLASSEGNTLVSSQHGKYQGYDSTDFLIYNSVEKANLKGRLIMKDQRLYQIMIYYKEQKFLSSFEMK
jgi:hypothetical protein